MKKILFTLLAALLTLPAALAQSWSGQTVDPTLYTGSRHVVYLKLNDPNETVNGTTLDVSKFIIVAFVGEGENAQLRSYEIGPQGEWNPDQTMTTKNHYFPITIFGEPADNGKQITFRLWDEEKSLEYVLPLNLTYSDGATASYPSQATAVDFTPVQSYSYPEDFYINKGETREFPITYVPANASHPIIAINTHFGNISIDGFNVTGNEYGYFYIYLANWQGIINGCVVNPIESVTITDPEKLYVGELRELQLNIVGKDHNDTEYVYCDINVVYNNPTIVDDYGKGLYYNALSRGAATATVTVTGVTSDTPIILTAHFNVLQPITDITVPETAQTLWSHKSYNVNQFITVTPDVVDEKVAYGVPDSFSDVISVDADGNIEIKGTGSAQINVWPEDHESPLKTIDFEIKKAATDFSVKDNPIYMIKHTRKAINECITITPEDYSMRPRFTLQSSDETVVTVVQDAGNGAYMNAVGPGTATITINMAYTNVPELADIKASHTMQVIVTEALEGFTIVEADDQRTVWASNLVENVYTLKPDPEGARFDLANISLWANCEWHVYQEAGVTKISLTPYRIGSSSFDVLYDNGTEAGLTSTFYLNVGQKYSLNTGWSWTTSPYMYVDVKAQSGKGKLYDIFDGGLDEMRSFSSMVIWDPGWNMYVGDIDDYTFDHYKVKMKEAKEITVFGTVKNEKEEVQVPLSQNWTWAPNLFQQKIDLDFASELWYENFADGAQIITMNNVSEYTRNEEGTYPLGYWTPNLILEPGEGFLINAKAAGKVITYPEAGPMKYPQYDATNNAPAKKYWEYDLNRFMNNMAITAQIVDLPEAENFTVGAFVGDECRGEAVFAKDRWFVVAHGEGGDVVTLKLMDKFSGEIYDLEGSWSFTQSLGSIKEPVVIASPVIETDGIITPIASSGISVDGSSIVGEGIEIYDLQGRNVTESNGQLTNGVYIVRSQGKALKVTVK